MEFQLFPEDPLRSFFEGLNWPGETKRLETICTQKQEQLAKDMNVDMKTEKDKWNAAFKNKYDSLTKETKEWTAIYKKLMTGDHAMSNLDKMEKDILEILNMCQDPEVLGLEKTTFDVMKIRRKFVEKIGAIRTFASPFLTCDVVLMSENQRSTSGSNRLGDMLIFSMYRTALAKALLSISHSPLFKPFFHKEKKRIKRATWK